MTVWGAGPFDNHDAMAFCNAMADHGNPLGFLVETLNQAAQSQGPVTLLCARRAVAACHLLAVDLGFTEPGAPAEPDPPLWAISRQDALGQRALAVRALQRVMAADSELRRHWQGRSGEETAWLASVQRLALHLEAGEGCGA